MKTKFYSILTALALFMPTFATVAKADDPPATSSSGYYKFEEDFTGYDENNSEASWPFSELENGAGKVVATRADGTKWVCSTQNPSYPQAKQNAIVKFDTANDVMQLKGWGYHIAMVYADVPDEFEVGEVQRIHIKTPQRGQRQHGMMFFMNETKGSYILFGQADNEDGGINGTYHVPYVAVYSNTSLMNLQYDASNAAGFNNNDSSLEWDIEIAGNYMRWTATSGQGREWSGSLTIDKDIAEDLFSNYEYLAGFMCKGDKFAQLSEFTYETGSYYSPEMGEPKEVLYKDLFATSTDVTSEFGIAEGDTHKIYKFAEATPVRRMICADRYNEVELSADGVTFDKFDCSTAPNQVNTRTNTEYRYVRVPAAPTRNFKLFTQVKSGDTLTVRKGGSTEIALYRNGARVASAPFKTSDSNYATVSATGVVECKKEGDVTISLAGEQDNYEVNIVIEGPLSDALKALEKGDSAPMTAYVATQQAILNTLNTAITNNDKTAVQNFFGTTGTNTLNDMDLIDSTPFTELKFAEPLKFGAFANRILTYKDGFHCGTTADEIEAVEVEFLKELTVGKIEGLTYGNAVIEALEDNNDILKLDLSDKYYSERKVDIASNFINATFANYDDLKNRVSQVTVLENLKKTINADFVIGILEDFEETIGYNKTHYEAISDKTAFANSIVAKKAEMTDTDKLKDYIDAYVPTAAPTPTTRPSNGGGGGGGSTGGSLKGNGTTKTEYVNTENTGKENEKTEKDPAVDNAMIFTDIPTDHWCYEAIRYLKAKNSINGYDDGSFMPNNSITRAEFIKMLVGMFAPDTELAEDFVSQFTDLNGDEWYYESMAKAEQLEILQGTDGKCNPNGNITRQEIAVITYRMIEKLGKTINRDSTIEKFVDENEIADWASTIVFKMQAAGIINGTDGKFMPNGEATRTMAAQILYKAAMSFENPDAADEGKAE